MEERTFVYDVMDAFSKGGANRKAIIFPKFMRDNAEK